MEKAHDMLNKHELLNAKKSFQKKKYQNRNRRGGGVRTSHQFAQKEGDQPIAGTDGQYIPRSKRFKCQRMGQYTDHCPMADSEDAGVSHGNHNM